jgi:alpha-L-rhamnosidase
VLGDLTSLDATAATPRGPVRVSYRVSQGRLSAEIQRPPGLPGEFVWQGRSYPLSHVVTRLELP